MQLTFRDIEKAFEVGEKTVYQWFNARGMPANRFELWSLPTGRQAPSDPILVSKRSPSKVKEDYEC